MHQAFPDRVVQSPLVPAMVKQGRLGQKSGRGFYRYTDKRGRPQPDPDLEPVLATYRRAERRFDRDELTDRLFLPMLLEATRMLQDRIVRDVRDVDLGLIFGLGFPAFQGGLLFWADRIGAANLLRRLAPLQALGPRFQPTPMLEELAATGGTFYPRGGTP
jgi:3-hydroxyacyl-CoA dehydrogenase/enoyl-CoA hydratase/3-hydroxybutyryl-CoA epimerase/3-hydroxyacyl-CoA dehydrogenase/enoyl-CoA hydratase/3-hydroxybutyryl-CoA epimerase/enoyl-CoA isomerase